MDLHALRAGGFMDDKDKVQAYISLYMQQMERYNKTQDIEWKANFGIWTLLAGSIYLAAKERVIVSPCLTAIVLAVLVSVHFGWLLAIHSSEAFDKKLWVKYRNDALLLVHSGAKLVPDVRPWYREPLWVLLEVGMTAVLSLVLFSIMFWRLTAPK
jgi:hypothetical protein